MRNYRKGHIGSSDDHPHIGSSDDHPHIGSSDDHPHIGSSDDHPHIGSSDDHPHIGSSDDHPHIGSSDDHPHIGSSEDHPHIGSSDDHPHVVPGAVRKFGDKIVARLYTDWTEEDHHYPRYLILDEGRFYASGHGFVQSGYLEVIKTINNREIKDTILFVNDLSIHTGFSQQNRPVYFKVKKIPVTIGRNVTINLDVAYNFDYVPPLPRLPKIHVLKGNGYWKLEEPEKEEVNS